MTHKSKFTAQSRFVCPEGKKTGNERKRQEIEDTGEGEGNQKKRVGYLSQRDKGRPLDREETDVAHR